MADVDGVGTVLDRITAALPGGEGRPGQRRMAVAVAQALSDRRHLLVQAGTGTGKSLAYLVPCILSRRRCVVVTVTKTLQEQLIGHDIPLLRRAVGRPFRAVLLKGRSNYLCRAALAEVAGGVAQETLAGPRLDSERLSQILAWEASTPTGDRTDLPIALGDLEWAAVSVGVGECPGASRCPSGETCFAERARDEAEAADLVVVNAHLYGLHLATGGALLPDHDAVVIDEAHAFEDIAAETLGTTVAPGRLEYLARACRGLFAEDHHAAPRLEAAGARLAAVLAPLAGRRVDTHAGEVAIALLGCAEAAVAASSAARTLDARDGAASRRERLLQLASGLAGDVRAVSALDENEVAWVRDGPSPALRVAPVDVGETLATELFGEVTVVLTSATLAVGGRLEPLAVRLGMIRPGQPSAGDDDGGEDGTAVETRGGTPCEGWSLLDVGSPFDYARQALLYCAAHLPDPRAPGYPGAMLAELEGLVRAAGGRSLVLFTSRRAMELAADALGERLPYPLLVQGRAAAPVLQQAFLADEESVLLATMGFWQGFDAPGATCSLVAIDRIPFSRPDEPLAQARREAAARSGEDPFATVDLPRAAVLLAQGVGRLIRRASDRGVVAVLDRRLATASYRWTLVRSLPPMRRTKDPAEARRVLAEAVGARDDVRHGGGAEILGRP